MYLFIDESGDPGCKGSIVQYFVISIIIFNDIYDLQKTEEEIKEFKRIERIKNELHFCKTSNLIRDKFFNYIKNSNFSAKAICVNKVELHSEYLIDNPDKLYNYLLKMLLDSLKVDNEIKIVLDGKGNKNLEKQLKHYLKSTSNINVKKIKIQDSKKDVLLQLADMVASSIGHSYNKKDKTGTDKWKNIIAHKINIWNFR